MQGYMNPNTALAMHKLRAQELIDEADEHRLLTTLKTEFVRRARRIVRITNS